MDVYALIFENRNLLKLIYTILIGVICLVIVAKTHKLFRVSLHQGIRYFRNAFLFYGLAFVIRYVLVTAYDYAGKFGVVYAHAYVIKIIFDFFLIMSSLFLLYSLLWKNFEDSENPSTSSLFNLQIAVFYILSAIVALLDYVWTTNYFMFLSQLIIFSFASGLCFAKLNKAKPMGGFFKLYFMVIALNFIAWLVNLAISTSFDFVITSGFDWRRAGVIFTYLLNIIIFVLFLYSVSKSTKR